MQRMIRISRPMKMKEKSQRFITQRFINNPITILATVLTTNLSFIHFPVEYNPAIIIMDRKATVCIFCMVLLIIQQKLRLKVDKQMNYSLVILLLIMCVQSQHQNGFQSTDQLVAIRKKQAQIDMLEANNKFEPEIPNHNKPYQQQGKVELAKTDELHQDQKPPETSTQTVASPHLTTILDSQENSARDHRDSNNQIALPPDNPRNKLIETSADSPIQKKTDDNLKTNDRKQPLRPNQQSLQTKDEAGQSISQKQNIISEASTSVRSPVVQDVAEGNSKESGVKNKYSQEQNERFHQKKQEYLKDTINYKQQIPKNEQKSATQSTKIVPEDEETIVIKPALKKKNQEQKRDEEKMRDTQSIPIRKELSDTKQEVKAIDHKKEGQEEKILKNREFQKENHPLEQGAELMRQNKPEIKEHSEADRSASINVQEPHYQTQEDQKGKDNKQSNNRHKDKQEEGISTKAVSPQAKEGKIEKKEIKDNDHKITIVPLETPETEEETDLSKKEGSNTQIDQDQLKKGQSAEAGQGQISDVLAPPLKKQEIGVENNKNAHNKQKHLEVQLDPKEKKEEVPLKVHEQKIQKLIEEVKNTKGELAEDSKKQIIKYLEAGKGFVKENEPKLPGEPLKPMLRVQKSDYKEQSSTVKDEQSTTQPLKEPQQMDTTTIVFIIVLTFVISIPIVKEIRRIENNQVQDQSINEKTSLEVEKVDSEKVEDLIDYNTVPNSSGYDTGERLDQIFS